MPPHLDDAIRRLGHDVQPGIRTWNIIHEFEEGYTSYHVPAGQARHMCHCDRCGATWAKRNRRAVLRLGPCPGNVVWAEAIPPSLDAPWIYPRASAQPVCWHGNIIHRAHALQFYRGCIYCNKCGARSARHFAPALGAVCRMKPTSESVARRLKRMRRGIWPDAGSDWPMPAHAQAPTGFLLLRPGNNTEPDDE